MRKVAVLGANGFVGSRLFEVFHLEQIASVRAVVRTFGGLAGLARFDFDWRKADALDEEAMVQALEGCEAVVSCVNGEAATIAGSAPVVYRAAARAGVKRLIYLSSFVVHGQAPAPGTEESAPMSGKSPFWYNNAKVEAEHALSTLLRDGRVEVVILRPGIVWGPRSPRWTVTLSNQLLAGVAAVVHDGGGICNTIFVDNLVAAIQCAIESPTGAGEAFFVGDEETVTWLEFYGALAGLLGLSGEVIHRLETPTFPPVRVSAKNRFDFLLNQPAFQRAVRIFPRRLKHPIRAAIASFLAGGRPTREASPWEETAVPGPTIGHELCLLQECSWKIPHEKASRLLNYVPKVNAVEAWRRTAGWLQFAGYQTQ
ncbi:MAG: hypothetical protein JWO82_1426 [Akkermansiaceae bacterium]|nr:hypothetical protein [Akkermansiaceae bacterium]